MIPAVSHRQWSCWQKLNIIKVKNWKFRATVAKQNLGSRRANAGASTTREDWIKTEARAHEVRPFPRRLSGLGLHFNYNLSPPIELAGTCILSSSKHWRPTRSHWVHLLGKSHLCIVVGWKPVRYYWAVDESFSLLDLFLHFLCDKTNLDYFKFHVCSFAVPST